MERLLSFCLFTAFLLTMQASLGQADVLQDFDSLGGNNQIYSNTKKLSPDLKVDVVQDRIVNRRMRHEFLLDYSNFLSGNTYVNTQSFGVGYDFVIVPRFSIGGRYFSAYNGLSKEGKTLINNDLPQRLPEGREIIPALDSIQGGYHAVATVYPFYGKLKVFDSIVHFDVYALGGYGTVQARTGNKPSYLYGMGIGFWLSQHLTSRVEFKSMNYKIQPFTGTQTVDSLIASFSLGYML